MTDRQVTSRQDDDRLTPARSRSVADRSAQSKTRSAACLVGGRPGRIDHPALQGSTRMTSEALSFTRSFSIALLALLEAVVPAAISVSLLYGLCILYDAEFKGFY